MRSVSRWLIGLLCVSGLLLAACATCRTDTGPVRKDAALIAKVEAALAADKEIAMAGVHVDSYRGKVQLSGYVDTDAMAKRAVAVAGKVTGVKQVINNMMVCGEMP